MAKDNKKELPTGMPFNPPYVVFFKTGVSEEQIQKIINEISEKYYIFIGGSFYKFVIAKTPKEDVERLISVFKVSPTFTGQGIKKGKNTMIIYYRMPKTDERLEKDIKDFSESTIYDLEIISAKPYPSAYAFNLPSEQEQIALIKKEFLSYEEIEKLCEDPLIRCLEQY